MASHGGAASSGAADLMLVFTPDAKAVDIAAFMSRHGLTITDGPRAGGVWRARVVTGRPDAAARDALVARIRGETSLVMLVSSAPN
jgi:hypothetical protein